MKKYGLIYIVLTIYLLCSNITFAQVQYSSYEGTHFIVGFMQNEIVIDPRYGGLHLKLFIFPSSTTNITIIFPNDSVVSFTNVKSNSNLEIEVPIQFENFESEVVRKKSIEIQSDNPIIVYAFSTQYLTSEAYTAIPVDKWGKEYVIVSYPNDQYSLPIDTPLDPSDSLYRLTPRQSEFLIMSAYDSTQITFYPRSITEKGVQVNNPKTIILNKGQTYLVKSFPFVRNYGDLSGTFLRGNKPFGVLSGHVRTAIPQNLVPKWDSKNHLVEMLMPANSWGREYITVPFGISPYGDLIKIVSYYPNTTITSVWDGGSQTYVLNNNFDVLEIPFVNEVRKWISDKPIQIAQFIMHSGLDWDSPNYDPAMTLVPPLEQYVNSITFQTPGNSAWNPGQFVAHYVNIIGTIDALNETYLNSVRIVDIPKDIVISKIFNDTYFWANIKIRDGVYRIKADQGKIAGVVYGVGLADAYALVLGSSLVNPFIGDSTPPELTYEENCGKIQGYFFETSVTSNTGIAYAYAIRDSTFNYLYSFSDIFDTTRYVYFAAQPIDPYKKGKVVLEVRDRNGNSRRLSFNYNPPALDYPSSLDFSNIKPFDSVKKTVKLKNVGGDVEILRIGLKKKDERFRWYVDRKIPFLLKANDTVSIFVTCAPQGMLLDLFDTLVVEVDCNLTFLIPINSTVLDAKLEVFDYDFGNVYIGDTAIGKVGIANLSELPVVFDSIFINSLPNVFSKLNNPTKFTLKPGDTIFFPIKFIPNDRKEFKSQVVFVDEMMIKPKAEIRGVGVAPLINSLTVDFGKLRVGLSKDTLVYLKNSGNILANVNFARFQNYDSAFDSSLFVFNATVSDTFPFKITFAPKSIGKHTTTAEYSVDWKLHPPLTIEAVGEGILPQIETYDFNFDTILVFDEITNNVLLLRSTGTEELYIKQIRPFSGESNSFEIDFNSLKDTKVPIDSALSIPIKFKPKFVGAHSLVLEIISDAVPGDSLVSNFSTIYGYARSRDTLRAEIAINSLSEYPICNKINLEVEIINKGNIQFPVQEIQFSTSNFILSEVDTSFVGKIIQPGEKISFGVSGFGIDEGPATIEITARYGLSEDSILLCKKDFRIIKLTQEVFAEPEKNPVNIGENYKLKVYGEFLNPSVLTFDFVLRVKSVFKEKIGFNPDNFVLSLKNSGREWSIPLGSKFSTSELELVASKLYLEGRTTKWEISLPFSVFLTNELFGKFEVNVDENHCYKADNNTVQIQIEPFCVYPLRDIELIEGAYLLDYYPNPVTDFLTLDFESKKKDFVILEIFDKLGNILIENMKIDVDVGRNQRKIDFSYFENGIYFVKLKFESLTKYILVFKLK